jgi:UTP:GlnB (protein PII) uridylyltransferase
VEIILASRIVKPKLSNAVVQREKIKPSCLTTTDHPGLLAKVAHFFRTHQLNLISAKITTIGSLFF